MSIKQIALFSPPRISLEQPAERLIPRPYWYAYSGMKGDRPEFCVNLLCGAE